MQRESAARAERLRSRTLDFSLAVRRFCRTLGGPEGRIIATQLLRAGTSVRANHRASRWARSRKEFAAKLGLVIEEADECLFWLELLARGKIGSTDAGAALEREARELRAIFVASRKTVLGRRST